MRSFPRQSTNKSIFYGLHPQKEHPIWGIQTDFDIITVSIEGAIRQLTK